MRAYITHFFGCQECRENFYRGAVHIEEQVTNADKAILFLWHAHNRANFNLKGDPSEDPTCPKVQFPTRKLCPTCHNAQAESDSPAWADPMVLDFLKNMYAKGNIVMDSVTEEEYEAMLDGEKKGDVVKDWRSIKMKLNNTNTIQIKVNSKMEKWRKLEYETRVHRDHISLNGWGGSFGMNGTDLSICILFYIICTLIIILLCFHFTVQKRMRLSICRKSILLPL